MTAIAKKKSYRVAKKEIKYRLNSYDWAESLFHNATIKAPVMHTLKAIIACSKLKQPTLEQINKARNKSCSLKFAQADSITIRGLRKHIKKLEELNIIKVERTRDERYNLRNAYILCFYTTEEQSSSSLSSPNPFRISSYASRFYSKKKKEEKPLETPTEVPLRQRLFEMRHTKLYKDAIKALELSGLTHPGEYISLTKRLSDSEYCDAEDKFNIALSDKMKELEQQL